MLRNYLPEKFEIKLCGEKNFQRTNYIHETINTDGKKRIKTIFLVLTPFFFSRCFLFAPRKSGKFVIFVCLSLSGSHNSIRYRYPFSNFWSASAWLLNISWVLNFCWSEADDVFDSFALVMNNDYLIQFYNFVFYYSYLNSL